MPTIPVYIPSLAGNEVDYVMDAVSSGWISSLGEYVDRFEQAIKDVTGAKHAIAVSNGSVALHLALHCLDVGPGDEVIVPTFTYIASVNAIALAGATPVFVDVPHGRLADRSRRDGTRDHAADQGDPAGRSLQCRRSIQRCIEIARNRGIAVVEDSAEVFGTTVAGTPCRDLGRTSRPSPSSVTRQSLPARAGR